MHTTAADLPATLPIFPLRGVLLLPGGRLPLNIFESRYLAMTRDALGTGRLIGMIQPHAAPHDDSDDDRPSSLYTIGCAGRIVQFEETPDGRFVLTLLGVCRFRLLNETGCTLPYRRFHVGWEPFLADLDMPHVITQPRRPAFIATACRYLERQGMRFDEEVVAETPLDRLATALAMICPFSPEEKQALLEAADSSERASMLMTLMEMALHDPGEPVEKQVLN